MKASIFTFASDLHDEGYDRVLSNVQHRASLQGVGLAVSYHHSRDLFPHNPIRKIHFLEGEVFFRPREDFYARTKIRPVISPLAGEADPLQILTVEAERRGLAVRAWTNNMHNTNLGSQFQDCVVQNAFGDPIITYLCPANPDVRAYVCALSGDIARYAVHTLLLESVNYMPYDHGYHHERTLLPLTAAQRFLMSLCFCAHCMAAARAGAVDVDRVRSVVREELENIFNGAPSTLEDVPLEPSSIGALVDGAMGKFVAVRQRVITTLVAEIVEAVRRVRDIPVVFIDMSGGLRAAGSGMTVAGGTAPAPERAWQDGIDLRAVAVVCSGLLALGYTSDPEQLRADLTAYRALLPRERSLAVALRPMLPDCRSAEDVTRLVRVVRSLEADWIDFYHYGMMPLTSLDSIRQALTDMNAR